MAITISMKNVELRGKTYHFRMAVPTDCREAIGQTAITESLKTQDPAEAAVKAGKLTAEWRQKFKDIREGEPEAEPARVTSKPSNTVTEFHEQLTSYLDDHWEDFVDPQSREDLLDCSVYFRDCIMAISKGLDLGFELTDVLGVDYPLPAKHTPGVMRKLHKVLSDVLEELRHKIDDELGSPVSQELDADVIEPLPATASANHSPQPTPQHTGSFPQESGQSVAEVLDECLKAKERTPQSQEDIAREVLNLMSWLGMKADTTPIASIKTRHIIDYRDNCLKHLVPNANKNSKLKGKSLKAQIALCKKSKLPTITVSTLNNRLKQLNVFFSYAHKRHYVPFAVSSNLQLQDTKKQAKLAGMLYDGFSDDQMGKLFGFLETNKGKHRSGYEWCYWIPMLLAYTGCRANEIAMLTTEDVKQEGDIWYLDLHNDPDKKQRVKNANSIRRVPVCQTVLDLGFLDYVNNLPDGRLWPTLTYDDVNKWARKASRYFNDIIRPAIGAKDVKRGFHGLRSSVSRALQRKKVDQRVIDEITGHAPTGVSQVALGYQGRLELKDLLEGLNKLSWPKEEFPLPDQPNPPAVKVRKKRRPARKRAVKKQAVLPEQPE